MRSMSQKGNKPATAKDAVDLATRWLGFQVELSGCRPDVVERDPFVAGYLWGFCGGVLAGLEARSPGLFSMFSMVARNVFGERDGPRVLACIHRLLTRPEFEDGEAAGLVDAHRSIRTDRSTVGLIAHLNGGAAVPPDETDTQ
jgi:hypothetical protein